MSNKNREWIKRAWSFLTSMQLGIILLVVITALSITGSVIPQREETALYFEMYGRSLAPGLLGLGLTDVFYSPWFITLALLLSLNLASCTTARGRRSLLRLFGPGLKNTPEQLKNCRRYKELYVQRVNLETVAEELKGMLKSNKYRVRDCVEVETRVFTAGRRVWGHLGSPILHLALVIIIAGSIIGGIYGKKAAYQTAVPGTIQLTRDGFPFDLKVGDFQIDYYPDGTPSQYRSQLSAVANRKTEVKKIISVNDPLSHRGVKVYQSSYGQVITGRISDSKNTRPFTVESGGLLQLAGPEELVLKVNLLPDYQLDNYGRPYSRSERPVNPRVVYLVYSHGMPLGMGEAELGKAASVGGLTVHFDQFKYSTGLMVKTDPGVPVVWVGFILLMLGLALHFYIKPQYVWAIVCSEAGGVRVYLGTQGLSGPGLHPDEELEKVLTNLSIKGCPA